MPKFQICVVLGCIAHSSSFYDIVQTNWIHIHVYNKDGQGKLYQTLINRLTFFFICPRWHIFLFVPITYLMYEIHIDSISTVNIINFWEWSPLINNFWQFKVINGTRTGDFFFIDRFHLITAVCKISSFYHSCLQN